MLRPFAQYGVVRVFFTYSPLGKETTFLEWINPEDQISPEQAGRGRGASFCSASASKRSEASQVRWRSWRHAWGAERGFFLTFSCPSWGPWSSLLPQQRRLRSASQPQSSAMTFGSIRRRCGSPIFGERSSSWNFGPSAESTRGTRSPSWWIGMSDMGPRVS